MGTILLAMLLTGQAAPAPAATGTGSPQQRFDTASEDARTGRCEQAVVAFDALEGSAATKRNALLAAAIAARKGGCLIAGPRGAEAEAAIRAALPVLEAQPDFAVDVRDARIALGDAARARFDYATAEGEYRRALDTAKDAARINPLIRLAMVTMFDGDGKAVALAAEAKSLALAMPGVTPRQVANVQSTYARALLNAGKSKEAYAELRDSVRKQGGLTLKVGVDELVTRSDIAIAALRSGDADAGRKYLAYTGAGRGQLPFLSARVMEPPACGGAARLSPDDQAIVQFSLADDGRVYAPAPIFTNGDRAKAVAFAEAVAGWSWRAEDTKAMSPLLRYTLRVELRCLRAPPPPYVTAALWDAARDWLGPTIGEWDDLSAAAALPLQRRAYAGADRRAALSGGVALLANQVLPDAERKPILAATTERAAALDAPPAVRAVIALNADNRDNRVTRPLLAQPALMRDPLVAATLRLLTAAPAIRGGGVPRDAPALLDAVIAEPTLPANHPLKVAALLQQANLRAEARDTAGAEAAFLRTGLTSEQCATAGLQPALRAAGATSADFPMEAFNYGFEGWVRTEADVEANGRTVAPRAVIAYPPFVFDDAAVQIARRARYTGSYRPAGALACSGMQMPVRFSIQ